MDPNQSVFRGRPAWAEIDLDAIEHNVASLKRAIGPSVLLLAVVKANAYGHGAAQVSRAALRGGADRLGVAFLEEAVQLRHAGITAPILVLGHVPPAQASQAIAYDLAITVNTWQTAFALSRQSVAHGRTARVHVKVDTGLGRFGQLPHEMPDFARSVHALPGIDVEGLWTHFASADEPDGSYTDQQLNALLDVNRSLRSLGLSVPLLHAANSAATMDKPQTRLGMVRCGLAIYGLRPSPSSGLGIDLKPAMSLKATLVRVRTLPPDSSISYGRTYVTETDTRVGLVPFGYADGFRRDLSNLGVVLVRGRRAPVIGRVCMDQFVVNLNEMPEASQDDEVVILGQQENEHITAEEIAASVNTINYEVISDISARVPRVYIRGGRVDEITSIGQENGLT